MQGTLRFTDYAKTFISDLRKKLQNLNYPKVLLLDSTIMDSIDHHLVYFNINSVFYNTFNFFLIYLLSFLHRLHILVKNLLNHILLLRAFTMRHLHPHSVFLERHFSLYWYQIWTELDGHHVNLTLQFGPVELLMKLKHEKHLKVFGTINGQTYRKLFNALAVVTKKRFYS